MAELSAVPFSALPQASDGYTVLYENDQVCRSENKLSELVGDKTKSFLTKEQGDSLYQEKGDYLVADDITSKLDKAQYAVDSATFLTAHQSLDEYATQEWVNNQGFLKEHQPISANEWNDAYETVVSNSGIWETETDWTNDINAASANAYNSAVNWVENQNYLKEHQDISNKLDTTSFSTVSSNFLTAHQSLDEYATQEWVENQNYITGVDLTNYYTKEEVNEEISKIGSYDLVNETTGEDNHPVVENPSTKIIYLTKQSEGKLDNYNEWIYKEDTDTFECIGETTLDLENYYQKNETSSKQEISDALALNSWKRISEQYGSKNTYGNTDNLSVYIGQNNSTNSHDSYTIGRDNRSKRGVNAGYKNIIDVTDESSEPGNFNFGKDNVISGKPGGVNLGQNNSAFSWGVNLGENNNGNIGGYNFGNSNSANNGSINIGESNSAANGSYNIGLYNTSEQAGYTFGYNNSANNESVSIGINNKTIGQSYVIGVKNSAYNGSYSFGLRNSAEDGSYIFGANNNVKLGGLSFGIDNSSYYGGLVFGNKSTVSNGSVAVGHNISAINGSIAIGARNSANNASFIIGNDNSAYKGTTTIGDRNNATYTDIIGNDNKINKDVLNYPQLSGEYYTKNKSTSIQINNFVAGLNNSADYAKNAYILGSNNTIISNSADYINENNDGYVFIYGWQNSAVRNYDMAIGYKSIASGGENIAIGVPFQAITRYNIGNGYVYPYYDTINTVAKGYKNFALRGNVTGISNTAINSNLTGDYIGDELGHVTANNLINSFVSATTVQEVYSNEYEHYGNILNNTIENSNVLLTGKNILDNKLTNVYNLKVSGENFIYNKFYHTNNVNLTGRNIDTNTFLHTNGLNIESEHICRNIILNCHMFSPSNITASIRFTDNIISKTDFAPSGNSISSINDNIIFNSYIDGSTTQNYISWDKNNDCNFTRNFLIGSYLGNYIYNTFSFCDNTNNSTQFKLENTIRTFNFGDNSINKSEKSFVFGDNNKTSAISRTFVLGTNNNIIETKLTNSPDDYVNEMFVFGCENNVIADNVNVTYTKTILERNRIFGSYNLIKSNENLNDNLIVGSYNSISYNTTKPSKTNILNNVNRPSTPNSSESAAFATYRNNILGGGNRISQCITDSLIVGAGNYVFDTTEKTPSLTADYNSIYTLGVGNVAYDGSNQLNIGYNNETSGHFAEAIGDGVIANGQQLIVGKCNDEVDGTNRYSIRYDVSTSSIVNIEPSGVVFAIGNGTYDYTTGTNKFGGTVYYDKNKNEIPSGNINNEEYITRSNAMIVSADGTVSATRFATSGVADLEAKILELENKITTLETIVSNLTSQA